MTFGCKFANSYAAENGVATLASLPAPWEIPALRKRYFAENSSPTYTPMTDAFNTLKPSDAIAIARSAPNAMVTFALPTPNAIVRTFFTKSEASWTKSGDM